MQILLSIDDTDDLESRGTGELASMISDSIEKNGWGKCMGVTRHQLFIHPDIPYTSHNSSMCFIADIGESNLNEVILFAEEFLNIESAAGSDPGLCIAEIQKIADVPKLIEFGKMAKTTIVTKQKAYELAKELNIHLSEHGGTGDGIIGALAGAGLRLSGNDGRFKGKIALQSDEDFLSAEEILNKTGIDSIQSIDGTILDRSELIKVENSIKAVLLNGSSVILVSDQSMDEKGLKSWKLCTKQQLRNY